MKPQVIKMRKPLKQELEKQNMFLTRTPAQIDRYQTHLMRCREYGGKPLSVEDFFELEEIAVRRLLK